MGLLTFIRKIKSKKMITFEKFQCTANQLLVLPMKERAKDNFEMANIGRVVKVGPMTSTLEYEEFIPGEEWKGALPNDMRKTKRIVTNDIPYSIDDIVFYSGKHTVELNGITYHIVSNYAIEGFIKIKE